MASRLRAVCRSGPYGDYRHGAGSQILTVNHRTRSSQHCAQPDDRRVPWAGHGAAADRESRSALPDRVQGDRTRIRFGLDIEATSGCARETEVPIDDVRLAFTYVEAGTPGDESIPAQELSRGNPLPGRTSRARRRESQHAPRPRAVPRAARCRRGCIRVRDAGDFGRRRPLRGVAAARAASCTRQSS